VQDWNFLRIKSLVTGERSREHSLPSSNKNFEKKILESIVITTSKEYF
jgi:hypothetical protein